MTLQIEPPIRVVVSEDPPARVVTATVPRTAVARAAGGRGPKGDDGTDGTAGAAGPAGPPGSPANANYTHTQNAVSADWTITHSLGFQPNVSAFDSGGSQVEGEVERVDNNNLVLHFTSAFAGQAFLS